MPPFAPPTGKIRIPYNYTPRKYQLPLLAALDRGQKYAAIVWARRHGKDITCWNYAIKHAWSSPMDVTYVFPTADMGKNNLWEAKTNSGFPIVDYCPLPIRKRRNRTDDGLNDTYKQIELMNGSIIRLASAERPDRLRGGNSKLYVLSEWAEMDPAVLDIIEPVVEANGGQILVNYTPKGDNHAKASWDSWQKDPDWFTQIITANDTDVFTPEQLIRIKRRIIERWTQDGRSETEAVAFFEQEYMCNFDTPVIGAYFGEGLKRAADENRITNVPWETDLPVNTYWDLGMNDTNCIWFTQQVNREIRFIDYIEMSGEGLAYYAKEIKKRPYIYGKHYLPHDAAVRELGTGVSREETLSTMDIGRIEIVPRVPKKEDSIDRARALLSRCWFDETKCERGIMALKNYTKKWDEKNKIWMNQPNHNWASNGSDAFQTFAMGHADPKAPQVVPRAKLLNSNGFF